MADRDPLRNPFDWFFRSALLVLGGAIALSVAAGMLRAIWGTVLVILAVIFAGLVGYGIWRWRRNRW